MQENPGRVPFGTRIIAFLWDYVLILGYIVLLVGLSFPAKPLLVPLFQTSAATAELTGFLLITLPVYLYFALCEGSKSHATWGKRKMGIMVAGMRGQPVGYGHSFRRSALKFIPWELAHFTIWHMIIPSGYPDILIYCLLAVVYGLVFLYLLSPLWSKQNQTLYDAISGTVIRYKG
ncbi:RDD family protein [Paenibacillus sepulcri]|uniref:RDD family protein n=1 Tax=Paenibacillus sepulcri TaxID=359917 RepID=A0ABS7C167_9BACL|nr:RDD family protein [Paenibacillus sepulcri]